jgi:hypothetical protein
MNAKKALKEHDEAAETLRAMAIQFERTRDAIAEMELQRAALDFVYACALLAREGAL